MFFISPAYAQATGGSLQDLLGNSLLVPMLLVLPIMYFFMFRPQQLQEKQRREMLSKMRRGDSVVLSGGIIGKINRVRDDDPLVDVEIAKGTIVQVLRASVSEVRTKGEPVSQTQARPKGSNVTKPDDKSDSRGENTVVDAEFDDIPVTQKPPESKGQLQGIIGRLLGKS